MLPERVEGAPDGDDSFFNRAEAGPSRVTQDAEGEGFELATVLEYVYPLLHRLLLPVLGKVWQLRWL